MRATVKARTGTTIEEIHNADVARWFAETHGDALLAAGSFNLLEGFNVLLWLPQEKLEGDGDL